jgi:hypothetical protein
VAIVRTDVSEELSASIIRVTRIDELGTLPLVRGVSCFRINNFSDQGKKREIVHRQSEDSKLF